jgi:hypothetical protein
LEQGILDPLVADFGWHEKELRSATGLDASGSAVSDRDPPIRDFFPKTESDLTSTATARVRRLHYRGECLLLRVKLAYGLTKANGRI